MKITIYELLGLVKDGKAPKKVIYDGNLWEFNKNFNQYQTQKGGGNIWSGYNFNILNYEVEIIEEEKKIPEKLSDILRVDDLIPPVDENMYKIWKQTIKNQNKINEICGYLKSKGE